MQSSLLHLSSRPQTVGSVPSDTRCSISNSCARHVFTAVPINSMRRTVSMPRKPHTAHTRRWKQSCAAASTVPPSTSDEKVVLVGDIGGTNCRLLLWKMSASCDEVGNDILFSKTYPTADYETFEDALDALYAEEAVKANPPQSAALAVAGPVINNRCQMTNLKWCIDGHELSNRRGILYAVLNDFEAVGYGITVVPQDDLVVLHDAPVAPKGPKAVLGPGTGLGEAIMVYEESFDGYRVWPSEGSHAAFAPRGWKQRALASFAEQELGQHCEIEHVACGSGLQRICRFLQSDPVEGHLDRPDYGTPSAISKAAQDGSDDCASEAVDIFLSIIGAEAGHMGLRLLATGGVFICGGIAPKLLDRIMEGGLTEAFLDRDARFAPVLKTFPLFVVKNDQLGLLGAREYALKLLTNAEARRDRQ